MTGLMAVLLTGCGSTASAGRAHDTTSIHGTVRLGLVTDLTGPDAIFGPPTVDVAKLAVAQINAAGGIDGRKVQLLIEDDQSTPQGGLQAAQTLIEQDHVSALVSMDSSAVRQAILPLAETSNTLYLYAPVFEGDACSSVLFTNGEVPNQQLEPAIPWIQKATGRTKWYLLGDNYIYPQKSFQVAKKYIAAARGTVVGETFVPVGTTDYQAVIQKIKSSGANIMLPYLVGSDAIDFEKQAYAAGLGNSKVQVLAGLYPAQSLAAMGAQVADGMDVSMGYFEQVPTAANAAFLEAYRAMFGANAPTVNSLSENTYVAIKAWGLAANKAKSTTVTALTKALEGLSFVAPAGKVTFQDNRYMEQPIYIAQSQANGSLKIIKSFGDIPAKQTCKA